jgi:hypothetical protein
MVDSLSQVRGRPAMIAPDAVRTMMMLLMMITMMIL